MVNQDDVDVPEDAGQYADGLAAILRRIHAPWAQHLACGPGWYPILVDLDADLAALAPGYSVQQVKEKFGGLRYYVEIEPLDSDVEVAPELEARFDARIRAAEELAERTCEVCGNPGTVQSIRGWYRTLCPECLRTRG